MTVAGIEDFLQECEMDTIDDPISPLDVLDYIASNVDGWVGELASRGYFALIRHSLDLRGALEVLVEQ